MNMQKILCREEFRDYVISQSQANLHVLATYRCFWTLLACKLVWLYENIARDWLVAIVM